MRIIIALVALLLLAGCTTAPTKQFSNFDNAPISKWEPAAGNVGKAINFIATQDKVAETNSFINANYRYVTDQDLYGKSDYWATPKEFAQKQAGDCEDFAIAKYATLVQNGIAKKDMRLLLIKQKDDQYHAILEVNYKGKLHFLDNKTNATTWNETYTVVYAVNDFGTWH